MFSNMPLPQNSWNEAQQRQQHLLTLFNQGYVQNAQDQQTLNGLSSVELSYIHDFYTVLEA